MSIGRHIARPMLAGMFLYGGMDAVCNPASQAVKAEKVLRTSGKDTERVVRFNGAVQVGAGALLALGIVPRPASLVLAGSLVPTTLAGHRFWEEEDGAARANQWVHFLKNVAMLGGLLIAAGDTEGRPSLGWRARRAIRRTTRVAELFVPGGD
jgi:putative oxidoreductase